MKKRGRKIQFNLSNRFLYTFIAIVVIISLGIVVYALAPGVAPNPGHTLSEVAPPASCASGQVLSWSGSVWSCVNNAGSGSSGGEALKKETALYKTTSCPVCCWGSGGSWCYGSYWLYAGTSGLITLDSQTPWLYTCPAGTGLEGNIVSCTSSNTLIGYSVDAVI